MSRWPITFDPEGLPHELPAACRVSSRLARGRAAEVEGRRVCKTGGGRPAGALFSLGRLKQQPNERGTLSHGPGAWLAVEPQR